MAACSDYLMRAFVPRRDRSHELGAYVAAEFGACREGWFLEQLTFAPRLRPRRRSVRARFGAAVRRTLGRIVTSSHERLTFHAEARRW